MSSIKALTMPKWGIEMREGTIGEWMVKEGDAFSRGDRILLIETDKITNEVEAEADGVLRLIVAQQGELRPVGALLAVLAERSVSDEDVSAFANNFVGAVTATAAGGGRANSGPSKPLGQGSVMTNQPISPKALELASQAGVDVASITGTGRNGRITHQDVVQASRPAANPSLLGALTLPPEQPGVRASPLALRLATEHGVNLQGVAGTGPRGRISKADVLAKIAGAGIVFSAASLADNTPLIRPMDKIRRVIARRLTEAKSTVPHYYLRLDLPMDALLKARQVANLSNRRKVSINDYIVRAVALALVENPDVNIQVHGDDIHHFPHADVAIAVASPRGLVTPVIRGANQLSVTEIAEHSAQLVEKAKQGKLSYQELDGGTFTISNLGMYGIEQFDAIINPPQGAILAVGTIRRVWVETPDGACRFESRMGVTMSCDHRAIDGAVGAAFLAGLKKKVESPASLNG